MSLIINSPFVCPEQHWIEAKGGKLEIKSERRPASYEVFDARNNTKRTEVLDLVNTIRARVDQWREDGWLGVTIQDVNHALADSVGHDRPRGALVSSVERGAPADDAGIKPGDVIIEVDGRGVEDSGDLPPMIAEVKPGTKTTLTVWRDKARKDVAVKVGELEDERVASAEDVAGSEGGKLGLAVRPLSPAERQQAETDGRLVVEEVTGPSAMGSEKGTPSSIRSAPAETMACISGTVASRAGSPAVTKGIRAVRRRPRSSSKRAATRLIGSAPRAWGREAGRGRDDRGTPNRLRDRHPAAVRTRHR